MNTEVRGRDTGRDHNGDVTMLRGRDTGHDHGGDVTMLRGRDTGRDHGGDVTTLMVAGSEWASASTLEMTGMRGTRI